MPQRRRVLGARHRDVHDPRRHLHAPLRLLQCEDRASRPGTTRSSQRASRARSHGWGCATPSSPPSTATTCRTSAPALSQRDPRGPPPGPRLPDRGPDARLPGPGDAARAGRRRARPTSSTTTSRSCRAFTRSRGAARSSCALRACSQRARSSAAARSTTKSGLMVGLGETHEEMVETFGVLREHGVQVLTSGQYLRPSAEHLPIVRYWHPDEFAALEQAALRARLRARRRRAARALLLPRRPARAAGARGQRPARALLT